MAAIAAMRRPIAPSVRKVTRHFFQGNATGGGATKQFDPTTQVGVQAPARYWDPLGLSIGTDEAAFKRRRAVEIKHGRICMLACIGYIVPEYFEWPGGALQGSSRWLGADCRLHRYVRGLRLGQRQ